MTKPGRPKKPPTQIIRIQIDEIPIVEKLLGRKIAENQVPNVLIRVPVSDVNRIRKALKR
jgi:hypothetical protein